MSGTLQGLPLLRCALTVPRWGSWHADAVVASGTALEVGSRVSLVLGGATYSGTIRAGGAWRDVVASGRVAWYGKPSSKRTRMASAEFAGAGTGWFDRLVNGLNRLPRPMLAFGTLALFGYAMVDPDGFGARMTGLNQVPEPLWWLLGAIVGFYFGAREAHHFRARTPAAGPLGPAVPAGRKRQSARARNAAPNAAAPQDEPNAALDDWRRVLAAPSAAGASETS